MVGNGGVSTPHRHRSRARHRTRTRYRGRPASALNVSAQAQVRDLLQNPRDQLGLLCLFIAHDLSVIERPSDGVAVTCLWTAFVQDAGQPDPIVQLAVAHVEFEALHPFRDGNGRLGRMLIPLFLHQRVYFRVPTST